MKKRVTPDPSHVWGIRPFPSNGSPAENFSDIFKSSTDAFTLPTRHGEPRQLTTSRQRAATQTGRENTANYRFLEHFRPDLSALCAAMKHHSIRRQPASGSEKSLPDHPIIEKTGLRWYGAHT